MKKIIFIIIVIIGLLCYDAYAINSTVPGYVIDTNSCDFFFLWKQPFADSSEYITPDDGSIIRTKGSITNIKPGGFAYGTGYIPPYGYIITVTGLKYTTGRLYRDKTIKKKFLDSLQILVLNGTYELIQDTVFLGDSIVVDLPPRRLEIPKNKITNNIEDARNSIVE